jgi:hypothetical protein
MPLDPQRARELLPSIDPGRLLSGRPVGLRNGALLALVAAGATGAEISRLRAKAIAMKDGRLFVLVTRGDIRLALPMSVPLASRLLAWLNESRLWGTDQPVFAGPRGPLSRYAIYKILARYARRKR